MELYLLIYKHKSCAQSASKSIASMWPSLVTQFIYDVAPNPKGLKDDSKWAP